MPDKLKFVSGAIFALVVVHDIHTQIKRRKDLATCSEVIDLMSEANDTLVAQCEASSAQIKYLCHMLDENEVPADEFDLIVLNFNQ